MTSDRSCDILYDLSYDILVQVDSLNDSKEFDQVRTSMRVIGYSTDEVDTIWKLLSTILHLVSEAGVTCTYICAKGYFFIHYFFC